MKLFAYEGELYLPEWCDVDPVTGLPDSPDYQTYELNDKIELTPEQCCVGYGNILQILLQAGQARKV